MSDFSLPNAAETDQLLALLRDTAGAMATAWLEMVEKGVPLMVATQLTQTMITSMFRAGR